MSDLTVYQFTQSSASTTWTINHNLGVYPIVDILINDTSNGGMLTKMIPLNITIIDVNNITVSFSTAQTGQARLV